MNGLKERPGKRPDRVCSRRAAKIQEKIPNILERDALSWGLMDQGVIRQTGHRVL
jgi:hypothetical protein